MVTDQFVKSMCLVLMTTQMSVYGLWTKYSAYPGWRLNGGSTFRTRHQYECAWLAQMTESTAVSFRDEMECRTGGVVPMLIKGDEGDVAYIAPISNRNKAMFIKGDNAYSYSSINEAALACDEFGLRLMLTYELQQVLASTWFTSCSCGWTSNGVTQSIDGPDCNATTRAITTCSGVFTAHAWCHKYF